MPGIYDLHTTLIEDIFTQSHLVVGDDVALIDTGTKSTYGELLQLLDELDLQIGDLNLILQTHAHPDHIGANRQIAQASGCLIGAHRLAAPWIEDHQLQFTEVLDPFPEVLPVSQEILDFYIDMVDGGTRVQIQFEEGVIFDLGRGISLEVFHLPGHTPGDVGYYLAGMDTMIIGDTIPLFEDLAVALYSDPSQMQRSLQKLQRLRTQLPFDTLLTGHYLPLTGSEIDTYLQRSLDYIENLAAMVLDAVHGSKAGLTHGEIAQAVAQSLEKTCDFSALTTTYGHLKELESKEIILEQDGRWRIR